jgi:uncharacterized protein (TIGR02117 family)
MLKRRTVFVLKIMGRFVVALFTAIGLYLLIALVLALIPTEEKTVGEPSHTVYLLKSGPHTDFFLPVQSTFHNWAIDFPYANNTNPDTSLTWVAIGWGDKDFYINTPTWDDLTAKTAIAATFGTGTAAVHASYYFDVPTDGRPLVKLELSDEQYQQLITFIRGSLASDAQGRRLPVTADKPGVNGAYDRYYEAHGTYSMVYTCNTWINCGLKAAGKKACYWTGFAEGIFYHYE